MGRKPVLNLVGMFLAGVTLTGCENTDWCCFGNKTEKPVTRPAPNWNTPPQNQAPATTGFNRTSTPSDQSVVKPDTGALPMRDSNVVAPQTGFQGTTTTNNIRSQDIVPPSPPSSDPQPSAIAQPRDNTPLNPLTPLPRTSTPRVDLDSPLEPPPASPMPSLPALEQAVPPVPAPPSKTDEPPVPPAPPIPAPGSPMKSGSTQSSSKYQAPPLSPLDIEPPPPPKGVPVMPGAGPSGN